MSFKSSWILLTLLFLSGCHHQYSPFTKFNSSPHKDLVSIFDDQVFMNLYRLTQNLGVIHVKYDKVEYTRDADWHISGSLTEKAKITNLYLLYESFLSKKNQDGEPLYFLSTKKLDLIPKDTNPNFIRLIHGSYFYIPSTAEPAYLKLVKSIQKSQ